MCTPFGALEPGQALSRLGHFRSSLRLIRHHQSYQFLSKIPAVCLPLNKGKAVEEAGQRVQQAHDDRRVKNSLYVPDIIYDRLYIHIFYVI